MTESIALALLKLLLAEAPGVVLWVLRQAGIVPSDSGHAPIENMRRVADVMTVNPMVKARSERGILEGVDAWPPEYTKPEGE